MTLLTDSVLTEALSDSSAGGSIGDELGAKKLSASEATGPRLLPVWWHCSVCRMGATMRSVLNRMPALARPIRRSEPTQAERQCRLPSMARVESPKTCSPKGRALFPATSDRSMTMSAVFNMMNARRPLDRWNRLCTQLHGPTGYLGAQRCLGE